ncbi:8611_t:CDS:2, partial [Racocetra persica]
HVLENAISRNGDCGGQCNVGWYYAEGFGTIKDDKNAASELQKMKRKHLDGAIVIDHLKTLLLVKMIFEPVENIMSFTDIKDFIYYAFLKHKNLDDNLEGQASFQLQFNIDLDSIYKNTSTKDIIKEKNSYIVDLVINEISCGDGYIYIFNKKYNSKNSDFTTLTYWCNARKELSKPQRKVEDISKQHNSEPYIEHYEYK